MRRLSVGSRFWLLTCQIIEFKRPSSKLETKRDDPDRPSRSHALSFGLIPDSRSFRRISLSNRRVGLSLDSINAGRMRAREYAIRIVRVESHHPNPAAGKFHLL